VVGALAIVAVSRRLRGRSKAAVSSSTTSSSTTAAPPVTSTTSSLDSPILGQAVGTFFDGQGFVRSVRPTVYNGGDPTGA